METLCNLPALASPGLSPPVGSRDRKEPFSGGRDAQPPCGSATLETVSSIVPKQTVIGEDGMCRQKSVEPADKPSATANLSIPANLLTACHIHHISFSCTSACCAYGFFFAITTCVETAVVTC